MLSFSDCITRATDFFKNMRLTECDVQTQDSHDTFWLDDKAVQESFSHMHTCFLTVKPPCCSQFFRHP